MINTELDFKLTNDEVVKLTLNFKLLLKVKSKYPNEYEEFNKVVLYDGQKKLDIFDMLSIIYVAYLCANIDDKEKYSKDEFVLLVPFDLSIITNTQNKLLGIKKK